MNWILLNCSLCDRTYDSNGEFKAHKKVYHPKISNFQVPISIFDKQNSPERNFNESTSQEIVDLDGEIIIIEGQKDRLMSRKDKGQVSDKIEKAIKSLYTKNKGKSRAGPKSSKKLLTLVPKLSSRGPLSKKSADPKGFKSSASSKESTTNSKSAKLENLKNLSNANEISKSLDFSEFFTLTTNSEKTSADPENTDFSDFDGNQ